MKGYGLAVVTAWPWPARNGVTSKTNNLITTMAMPVHVFSPDVGEHPLHVHAHRSVPASASPRLVRYLDAIRRRSLAVPRGLEVEAVLPGIKGVLETEGPPAFIHLDTMAVGHLVRPIRQLCFELGMRSPIVLSINDSYSHLLRDVSRLRFPPARLAQLLYVLRVERRLLPQADVVDVVSRVDERWLRRMVPDARVRVLPLGVTPAKEFPPRADPRRDVLLFGSTAGLEEFMVDLHAQWEQRGFAVAMVGPAPNGKVLELLHTMDGHHLGFADDLAAEFLASRIVVAPSQQRAGMSTKALHAMAVGVPVAGGRCLLGLPGFEPGVHGLFGGDSQALAAAVAEGLADDAKLQQIGDAGIALARTMLTWTDVCDRYLDTLPVY